jgi:hypothetical protein
MRATLALVDGCISEIRQSADGIVVTGLVQQCLDRAVA